MQDAGGNFLRRVGLVVYVDCPIATDFALYGANSAIGVGDGLALGDFANQNFAIFGECDNRGGSAGAFSVSDDDRVATFEDADDGVRGTEVDTDSLCHGGFSLPERAFSEGFICVQAPNMGVLQVKITPLWPQYSLPNTFFTENLSVLIEGRQKGLNCWGFDIVIVDITAGTAFDVTCQHQFCPPNCSLDFVQEIEFDHGLIFLHTHLVTSWTK